MKCQSMHGPLMLPIHVNVHMNRDFQKIGNIGGNNKFLHTSRKLKFPRFKIVFKVSKFVFLSDDACLWDLYNE